MSSTSEGDHRPAAGRWQWVAAGVAACLLVLWVAAPAQNRTALVGFVLLPLFAWLLSLDRRAVPWRTVLVGTAIQVVFALLILRTKTGERVFATCNDLATRLLGFTDEGARFIFGEGFAEHFFAFKVLSTIIFFSSLIAVLYYFGVLQLVVKGFAQVMVRLLRTSGAESLSASANIFVGQTEAPLLIRPYVATMTRSELMAVMTGGFATIAGGVLAAYVEMGVSAGHLIAASVMSAPAALVMAKLMLPEREQSQTAGRVKLTVDLPYANVIDAAAQGAADGLKLALNVGAMLLAFIALIAVLDAGLGALGGAIGWAVERSGLTFLSGVAWHELDLRGVLGQVFRPLAWIVGVPWAESDTVGSLLGLKTVINEFVAYQEMQKLSADALSERSRVIATYALCGFSNFSSIAIQIGGIGSMAPERKGDLARLGLRAMIAGTLACLQTATIAGLLF